MKVSDLEGLQGLQGSQGLCRACVGLLGCIGFRGLIGFTGKLRGFIASVRPRTRAKQKTADERPWSRLCGTRRGPFLLGEGLGVLGGLRV